MTKDRFRRRDLMREQLVHQAARLMAEDGITDHALAKRKAARQLGVEDSRHLPSDQEIDNAVVSYRALFQQESFQPNVRRLREEALAMMKLFKAFDPYLTGAVLNGTSGKNSDINIVLFSDDVKAVMLFLLSQNIPYEEGESKLHMRGRELVVPSYTLTSEAGTDIHILVLPENMRHSGIRQAGSYADINAVASLLAG